MHPERIAVRPVCHGLAAAAALACVAGGTWWRAQPTDRLVAISLEPAGVAPVEVAVPFAMTARAAPPPPGPPKRACPAPRVDAPMVEVPHFEDSFVDHVLPAPTNARWIAAWSGSNLYVSYDAGASFTHVLEAEHESLGDVAFDCYGDLIATANDRLAIYDGRKLRWTDLPHPIGDAEVTLVSGGPDIVVLDGDTRALAAVSHDLGASWEHASLGATRVDRAISAMVAADDAVLVPGARPAVLKGDVLYAIENGRAREVMRWPVAEERETLEPVAIDRANRVWGVVMRGGGDCDGTARPVLVGRAAR